MYNAQITPDLILDARLALYNCEENWLAIADLHYGYEMAHRARGWLLPWFGMDAIEQRLRTILDDYQPHELILVGDIVHSTVSARLAAQFLERVASLGPELHLVRGNHDRGLRQWPLQDSVRRGRYRLHHGHLSLEAADGIDRIDIIGHHHPSWLFVDRAGTRLRAPALVVADQRYILPAFSPWAAGVPVAHDGNAAFWVCTKRRVFQVKQP
jgi:putative SbcD/Mre11-related phosphoesterase